jgi:hypothetical protein
VENHGDGNEASPELSFQISVASDEARRVLSGNNNKYSLAISERNEFSRAFRDSITRMEKSGSSGSRWVEREIAV